MGFISFVGRVLFASLFLLSAYQEFIEFGNDGGPAAKALKPKFNLFIKQVSKNTGLGVPHIDIKTVIAATMFLKGFGGLLFIFSSSFGAFLLAALMHTLVHLYGESTVPSSLDTCAFFFKNFAGVDYGYYYACLSDDNDMSSSGNEDEAQSPRPEVVGGPSGFSKAQPKNTRFVSSLARQLQRQCSMSPHAGRPRRREEEDRHGRRGRMTRNRSMVDMRSQLLHRTLVEELNRRLFFNTVGAVENIGFRAPTTTTSSSSSSTRGRRSKDDKHHQNYVML